MTQEALRIREEQEKSFIMIETQDVVNKYRYSTTATTTTTNLFAHEWERNEVNNRRRKRPQEILSYHLHRAHKQNKISSSAHSKAADS